MSKNGAVLEIEQRLEQELNGDAWTGRMQRPEMATPEPQRVFTPKRTIAMLRRLFAPSMNDASVLLTIAAHAGALCAAVWASVNLPPLVLAAAAVSPGRIALTQPI